MVSLTALECETVVKKAVLLTPTVWDILHGHENHIFQITKILHDTCPGCHQAFVGPCYSHCNYAICVHDHMKLCCLGKMANALIIC